ncbi:hypothetical protein DPEC_G00338650 [Dallia pectoralis]|uniref:Uncharacterized protein n=1 Tax=Dallia pectoralis TaxID=75939 RepID=A0ACC2F4U1_DALPE|nr:hypothetical protein DPEC_G00338650 [Dallia pectoralis]
MSRISFASPYLKEHVELAQDQHIGESEEEEDHRKKFKIKIKPLPAESACLAPSVDELKASIGNIALSPSPLGLVTKDSSDEMQVARPRRPAPIEVPMLAAPTLQAHRSKRTPAVAVPEKAAPLPEDTTALFGPPLETAFGEQKSEAPPPLPPKNVLTPPPTNDSPSADAAGLSIEAEGSGRKTSIPNLDTIFGPAEPPAFGEESADKWVCFSEDPAASERPAPPNDPGPPMSTSPPPLDDPPAPPVPTSPLPPEDPVTAPSLPALPSSPPPREETVSPMPTSSSPTDEPVPPLPLPKAPTRQPTPPPPKTATPPPTPPPPTTAPTLNSPPNTAPPLNSPPTTAPPLNSPPTTAPPLNSPPTTAPVLPVSSTPKPIAPISFASRPVPSDLPSPTSPPPPVPLPSDLPSPTSPPPPVPVPSDPPSSTAPLPPVPAQEERKSPEVAALPGLPALPKEDLTEATGTTVSPRDVFQVSRAAPPPPPPPTYRAVVSSPGPTTTGTGSGTSSPIPPATPSAPLAVVSSPTPPPPPPRPPSRPKLPPGKPSVGDVSRSFNPSSNHSSSPPPVAPLARAESTSSISSNNSLSAATTPTVENDQPSLVWFDRGKFYLTFEGCSRGPSPLTMGAQDTLPVAAAFTETVNAFFKGADPNKCIVKVTGEMVLSFPAGITRHFANNPSPAMLTFSITNYSRLEHVLPNPQLLCCDTSSTPNPDSKTFWVNMPNLMVHLKKVSEQKPQATYYNVDMLKYQVSAQGLASTPLSLAASWRCEPTSTDLRIDYKYNGDAMTTPVALNNIQFLIPVDGGVSKLQAVLPPAAWNAEQKRILWKIPDISQKSENGGVGSLLARFQLSDGPSKPSPLAVQFTSEGSTLSGCDIELAGPGYRFSLIKKRFAAGKYLADV